MILKLKLFLKALLVFTLKTIFAKSDDNKQTEEIVELEKVQKTKNCIQEIFALTFWKLLVC